MSRLLLCVLLFVGCCFSISSSYKNAQLSYPIQAKNNIISYIIVGDWGADLRSEVQLTEQKSVANAMAQLAKQKSIAAVLNVGDNFYEDGLNNVNQNSLFRDSFINIFNDRSLKSMIWLNALGNHDYQGQVDLQLSSYRQSEDRRWFLPSRYYTLETEFVDMFFLDTNTAINFMRQHPKNAQQKIELDKNNWNEQARWFESELKRLQSNGKWKIVVGHHPIYCSQDAHSEDIQRALLPLFNKYPIHFYYSGHYHDLEHHQANGMNYIVSGAGCRVEYEKTVKHEPFSDHLSPQDHHTKFFVQSAGFVLAEMNLRSNTVTHTYYDVNLKQLYKHVTRKSEHSANDKTWFNINKRFKREAELDSFDDESIPDPHAAPLSTITKSPSHSTRQPPTQPIDVSVQVSVNV